MASFEVSLSKLIGRFDNRMKREFEPFHLNVLFSLKQVAIVWDFLKAAVTCWDPVLHVFRFGDKEICPTVEEFAAILGCPLYDPPALPSLDARFALDFEKLLDLSKSECKSLISDCSVNLAKLFERFNTVPEDVLQRRYFRRAICFLLLNRFLFVSVGDMGDASLIRVVDQMQNGRSFIHLVLAETLLCLDRLKKDPSGSFSGSPLLLQIWLQEHLRLIEKPIDEVTYNPRSFARRKRLYSPHSLSQWREYFHGPVTVRWVVRWWRIPSMIFVHQGSHAVQLLGLREITYIFPTRILRQYGRRQKIPSLDSHPPAMGALRQKAIDGWCGHLSRHGRLSVLSPSEDLRVSDYYILWLSCSSKSESDKLRRLEQRWSQDESESSQAKKTRV